MARVEWESSNYDEARLTDAITIAIGDRGVAPARVSLAELRHMDNTSHT